MPGRRRFKDDQIKLPLPDDFQGLFARTGGGGVGSQASQQSQQVEGADRVVFDDEHLGSGAFIIGCWGSWGKTSLC